MIPVHHCENCHHACQTTLSTVYCMHKENYAKPVDDYQIDTDAGYSCPLNKADPNYIPFSIQIDEEGITFELEAKDELMEYPCENIPNHEDVEDLEDDNDIGVF